MSSPGPQPRADRSAGRAPAWAEWATASLRRQQTVVLRGTVAMLCALALLCSAAVIGSAYSLAALNEVGVPLQTANKEVLQDITDAETAIRGYVLSDDTAALQPYVLAMAYLPQDERRLRQLAGGDAGLAALVATQEEATDRWLDEYVEPQLSPLNRGEKFRLYTTGKRLFDDIRAANAEVDTAIEATTQDISRRARSVLFWTLAAVVLLPLLMVAVATAMARRLSRAALEPLDEVSAVLTRLHDGDLTARAEERGPAEIRQIAAGLNLLAEESLRGRDIEDTVVSRIDEFDRARTELVSTVSHELRTPLTSVQGYLELIDDQIGPGLDDSQRAMMMVVRRNLARLQELISNLLTLSRIEEAGLKAEPLDLRAVAVEVVGDLRLTAASRSIRLRLIQSAASVTVVGDRTQLSRALTNLVSNAVKFSEGGDLVEVRVAVVGGTALVEVVDEGIGIPEADLDGIGSRFFRASNASRSEIAGTGLGLRIVQTIVDRHGGHLTIDTVENNGTTVSIRLPLSRPATPPADDRLAAGVAHSGSLVARD